MIAIIGGGISGLTLAYNLQKRNIAYVLLEEAPVLGGCIQTTCFKGVIAEKGPNSILANESIFEFLDELGLSKEIVLANKAIKKRFVYKDGRYRILPSGPISLLSSSFFSWSQRMKVFKEFGNRNTVHPNCTLYDLIQSRFGNEVADYVLDPFVTGIYAGDSKELIADLCFPVLTNNINQYGSILKGFIKNPPKRKKTITFKNGLSQLIVTLQQQLQHIRYEAKVIALNKEGADWSLLISTKNGEEHILCHKVVMCIPAYRVASLIQPYFPQIANLCTKVEYPLVYYVHLLFHKHQLGFQSNGFGALHPTSEKLLIAGVIWNSSIFDGRTSDDVVLLTCMINEKRTPQIKETTQENIQKMVVSEMKQLYNVTGDPISVGIGSWQKSIPQYNMDMLHVKQMIGSIEQENVFISSNWPNGISIADCIEFAKKLSDSF
jgi:oxygen-dependent protoporphyrinogen oxidase